MTTRIGIIGIGGFALHYHLPHLLARNDVSIAGVCDTNAACLEKMAPRLTDIPSFTDYRHLLELGLDALLVSSPNIYHFEQCHAALERGLHLLVDKPLTMTSDEATSLIVLARTRQRVLMTAYTRHFMASARRVKDHLAAGAIPQAITAIQRKNIDDRALLHGGILHARTVHIADLIPWLTGQPIIGVEGRIESSPEGYETFVDMRLTLKDGPSAQLLLIGGDGEFQDEVSVYCREQSFRINKEQLYASDRRGLWTLVDDLPDGGNSTDHFIDALQGKIDSANSPTALDGQDGLQALRVIEAIKEAGRAGRFVEIPET